MRDRRHQGAHVREEDALGAESLKDAPAFDEGCDLRALQFVEFELREQARRRAIRSFGAPEREVFGPLVALDLVRAEDRDDLVALFA
jgi:hypothetical protein